MGETDSIECTEDFTEGDGVWELGKEDGRDDSNTDEVVIQLVERILLHLDGIVGTHCHALATVNAEIPIDLSLSMVYSNCLGRTAFHAMGASLAGGSDDSDCMMEHLVAHASSFRSNPMVIWVCSPAFVLMESRSQLFLIFGSPMPAPYPSSRISSVAVDHLDLYR